jgi:hypothetical protein
MCWRGIVDGRLRREHDFAVADVSLGRSCSCGVWPVDFVFPAKYLMAIGDGLAVLGYNI